MPKTADVNEAEVSDENPANVVELKGALTKKLDEARATVAELEATMAVALDAKDMATLLAANEKLGVAKRTLEKAEKAVKDADFEARTAERMAVTESLHAYVKDAVESFLAGDPRVIELGMKAITVALNPDGSCNVSVTGPSRPSGGTGERKAKASSNGSGETKPRAMWTLAFEGGRTIGSAELLTEFGGEEGAHAIYMARDGWKEKGAKFSPGYDPQVKKLAKSMGWDGDNDTRVLTHQPE